MNQRYGKAEKLKHKKQIEDLFTNGDTISSYPVRLFYLPIISENLNQPTLAGVSVSKRNFKTAVARNKIKRLLREAYRKNKYLVNAPDHSRYWLMIIYIGKEIPKLQPLEKSVVKALKKLKNLEK